MPAAFEILPLLWAMAAIGAVGAHFHSRIGVLAVRAIAIFLIVGSRNWMNWDGCAMCECVKDLHPNDGGSRMCLHVVCVILDLHISMPRFLCCLSR